MRKLGKGEAPEDESGCEATFTVIYNFGPSARLNFYRKGGKWRNQVDEMVSGFAVGQTKFYRQVTHHLPLFPPG